MIPDMYLYVFYMIPDMYLYVFYMIPDIHTLPILYLDNPYILS